MIQFFESCWTWFTENRDSIVAFVTSSDFLATLLTVFTVIKSIKSTNKNTLSINSIKDAFKVNENIAEDVSKGNENSSLALSEIKHCENKIAVVEDELREFDTSITSKIDAVMEVMSIVYSTIKDDAIRNSVNSVLITAKHASDASKAKLEEEVDELKAKIEELTKVTTATVTETIDEIKSKIIPTKSNVTNTRY